MMKVQGTLRFTYDIKICTYNIISTASNIMMKVQDTMKFAYDITICAHNIISHAPNIMIKSQDTMIFAYYYTSRVFPIQNFHRRRTDIL